MDMTIHAAGAGAPRAPTCGRRWRRPNLRVDTGASPPASCSSAARAVGVEYRRRRAASSGSRAAREVILAGGAINSPQLLLLSGIGPADELRRARRRRSSHDLPGVGREPAGPSRVLLPGRVHASRVTLLERHAAAQHGRASALRWFLFHERARRELASRGRRLHPLAGRACAHPDIQFHFLPALVEDHGRSHGTGHAFQAHVGHDAAGEPRLARAALGRPAPAPAIQPNYLAEERDRTTCAPACG